MKYQHITKDEIKTIREAKKVMKKIAKRFLKLQKAEFDENVNRKPITKQLYRFCDEIDSIFDFSVDCDGSKISIKTDVDKIRRVNSI